MKWVDAIGKVHKATLTNREAAGLIRFGRAAIMKYAHKGPSVAVAPFDWYAYALPALGWQHEGDKFKVDAACQQSPYAPALHLWEALNGIARDLDASGVPFDLVVDPTPSDASYKKLASIAWDTMKADRAEQAAHPDPYKAPEERVKFDDGSDALDVQATRTKTPTQPEAPRSSGSSGGIALLLLLLLIGSKR